MNTKKIEDYLHLYVGCEVLVKKPDQELVFELVGLSFDSFNRVGNSERAALIRNSTGIWPMKLKWFKLLLRPLSSMTDGHHKAAKAITHQDAWVRDAERTRFLLSEGYDLFGLIEEGLAIDSTQQKP